VTILEQMQQFSQCFGKQITVDGTSWRYYRLRRQALRGITRAVVEMA
jgi:hypothetical protein